ncbi:MAG TPA: VOC family protein [Candidatus Kryptobacter bacterium]|nr:VOC family protein [Actinomycetota bacterium]MCL5883573.1 VOC family protein [Actinomycetota bacterium]HQT92618.1 VOC family protein [Candidatus Kryptobacter bacterium]
MNMTNISGPDFITLLVSDLETSYNFYKEKIGLSESSEKQPNARAFATKPCGLAIRQSPDKSKMDNPSQGIVIWLRTSDATVLYNDLKKRGVPIVEELRKSPFGMTFSFKDPDGYIMAVHEGG